MATKVTVTVETGYWKYPTASATFDGTNIARYWKDPHLRKALWDSVVDAKDDKDIFDFCNFLFATINQSIRRRYGGQELMLESVFVSGDGDNFSVTSFR